MIPAPTTLAALFVLAAAVPALQAQSPPPAPAHIVSTFRFTLAAPLARVAPLFGPEGERAWAGKPWNPVFLYPQTAKDTEGAVFTVQHGPHTSVWVNTVFDLAAGRMQYVSLIPDVLVSLIDVHLTAAGSSHTTVEVTYARTALNAGTNAIVESMGAQDRTSGSAWKKAIEATLGLPPASR
ncbi:MAG TPA: hypothetical protein VHU89_15355 [Acidobacteriaceae bacterium]|jgi:hypothetical protein|nr:hypothetical protein [Acidobacteriaceae bacterium]